MSFEVQHALRDLDEKTPAFFLQEMFSHGDLRARRDVLKVLAEVEPKRKSCRVLREILRLTP